MANLESIRQASASSQNVPSTEELAGPGLVHSDRPKLAVLTSGGDAPGMNAVLRAVVRTSLQNKWQPCVIHEGWKGAIAGGDFIQPVVWGDMSSILEKGGTVIGSARSSEFREPEGQRVAVKNFVQAGIDHLVVIGGDGSLTGANLLHERWPKYLEELVASGDITSEQAAKYPELQVVGVVGSIDNDLVGSDITVGTDTALHRILDAIDAITSTAASHQRTFIVEVMGRRCGYLALQAAVGGGADYVFIPEHPPEDGWEDAMCNRLTQGRQAGRRAQIIIVAEGCEDRHGEKITAQRIQQAIKDRLHESPRITALGHVQRGGTPSAYDRWMSTLLGYTAAVELMGMQAGDDSCIIGVCNNQLQRLPLVKAVANTQQVAQDLAAGNYDAAVASRGKGFQQMLNIFSAISRPFPAPKPRPDGRSPRLAIMHVGGLAPGMNPAARTAVRLGIDRGYTMLGVEGGFPGLIAGDVHELHWMDVDSWAGLGGAALGTRRAIPTIDQYFTLAQSIEKNQIDGIILIGGLAGYEAALALTQERHRYPAFNIPIVCVPATIDNNLPGADLSIGADSALNTNVRAIDKIRESASATNRCFVVEVMGRRSGYLALMSGIATGAEQVYLFELGITLKQLTNDCQRMIRSFSGTRTLYLVIRNENASKYYTTELLANIFEEEGGNLFDVRANIIGHQQQGGEPSPYDRTLAVKLVDAALDEIDRQFDSGRFASRYVGQVRGEFVTHPILHMDEQMNMETRLPYDPWWLGVLPVLYTVGERFWAGEQLPLDLYTRKYPDKYLD
ncbi:6-phosphofructokinase [Actinobaculum suis]|uniref:6-phosphofructokinase n=1 Tax=Actinobaculum suis TaxID=1657 RepID=A0A7Z8Y8D3_9ACTO|nr:6-phosphofructokinase [Actinobaculum suis]VDG76077.1 6-phosphofructokinase [Actinobaculum suis]